jgi:hypothetical protein
VPVKPDLMKTVYKAIFTEGSTVSGQPLTAEARVQSQANPGGFCVGQNGTGTGFSPSTSVFPCQYHSTIAPYSFIHQPHTLYNVFLPVLQFSPVSIIPPLLHINLLILHQRRVILANDSVVKLHKSTQVSVSSSPSH